MLLDAFRPGVTERLGIGPADTSQFNRRLVYGRLTGARVARLRQWPATTSTSSRSLG